LDAVGGDLSKTIIENLDVKKWIIYGNLSGE